jgi:hypothetical protein
MERYLGIIKIFNIVAGVLIVLGIIALVWLVIDRSRGTTQGRAPEGRAAVEDGAIALPAGFTIKQMAATGEFLFLLVSNEAGDILLLRLDPSDPAAAASFVIETARP